MDPSLVDPSLADQLLPVLIKLLKGSDGASPVAVAIGVLIASKAWARLYAGLREVLQLFQKSVLLLERLVEGDVSLAVRLAGPTDVRVSNPQEFVFAGQAVEITTQHPGR